VTVSSTAVSAVAGRLALARYADEMDARVVTAIALLIAAGSLGAMGLFPVPSVLIGASIVFGLTVGNITTLSPIIVRREFGAQAFGLVFGVASCGIQLAAALGPSLYGLLHDVFGSYGPALTGAACLDVAAAAVLIAGRRKPTRPSVLAMREVSDGASAEIELANSFSAANAGPPTSPPEGRQMPGTR